MQLNVNNFESDFFFIIFVSRFSFAHVDVGDFIWRLRFYLLNVYQLKWNKNCSQAQNWLNCKSNERKREESANENENENEQNDVSLERWNREENRD